jgi:hypothetical protein
VLERAHRAAPDDLEALYALYRHASTMRGPRAEELTREALERLAELRPENLFVLLKLGQQAVADADRETATRVYLRLGELVWQASELTEQTLDALIEALEADDLAAARRPSRLLENLFKGTPLFVSSLGELFTNVQGIPVTRFSEETIDHFGPARPVHFRASRLGGELGTGALVVADLDGDARPEIARITGGETPSLRVAQVDDDPAAATTRPATAHHSLRALDLDNDGALDLVAWGGGGITVWRGDGAGGFEDATARYALERTGATDLTALDYDMEGDLDLATLSEEGIELHRNTLEGPLTPHGERAFGELDTAGLVRLAAADLDRDGDLDLTAIGERGVLFLDNLRQGRFADRTRELGLAETGAAGAFEIADFDGDGRPDLALAGAELSFWRGGPNGFSRWGVRGDLPRGRRFTSLLSFDADNDGRPDLALGDERGLLVLTQGVTGVWLQASLLGDGVADVQAIATEDLDADGDLDLVVAGSDGLTRLDNVGGNRNGWLRVRLQGLDVENQKNNFFGLGSALEVFAGSAYQYREVTQPVTHLGLGDVRCPDMLRVTWTNGVPQNRLGPCREQLVVEEQVLKGSCPFLYTDTGDGVRFVTDLLWGAPLGMPVAEGVWAGADIEELVEVEGAEAIDGHYRLHVTEELWEAAYFDLVRLWVVDAPPTLEVASSLRIVPGEVIADRVLATAEVRPVAAAWDGRGSDVTARVAERDDVYADGYARGLYQGVAPEPWAFTFDLGEAPSAPVRLLLDGWIFPADASLNLAVAQRQVAPTATRLEMLTEHGWQVLVARTGHPAGKTKTMVIDTPPLPPGVRRLRFVTSKWLHWDRLAWSTTPADDEHQVRAKLAPASADLHYRGFSALRRAAPNAPHDYDYARVSAESPWLPLPGGYTRYGDVRELLESPDDRLVTLGPGDEMTLEFDASALPDPPPGWRRSVFLESHGWDKDADRNTWQGHRLEPLPFRAQSGYPWAPGESYPDTPALRRYREQWQTRRVEPTTGAAGGGV